MYLDKALNYLLAEVGNNPLVEVVVSDNASTDDTAAVVQGYADKYSNVKYYCNEKNLGIDGNIHNAYEKSTGKYVLISGDDDYFKVGTVAFILELLQKNNTVTMLKLMPLQGNVNLVYNYIRQDLGDQKIMELINSTNCLCQVGAGLVNFVSKVSIATTWISTTVLRRDAYMLIADRHRFDDSMIAHIYYHLAVLKYAPKWLVVYGNFLRSDSGLYDGGYSYNTPQVFIKNYFDILGCFKEINKDLMSREKLNMMINHVIPCVNRAVYENLEFHYDGFAEIIRRYYADEPYLEQAIGQIQEIINKRRRL